MWPSHFAIAFACLGGVALAADPAEQFETRVRPILVEHCYRCHAAGSKEPKGGLRVDGRASLLAGGDSGPAIVPGQPDQSKLMEAVRYKNGDLLMPPKGKLPDAAIRDLEAWVRAGSPWPNEAAVREAKATFDLARRKADHWAWRPLAAETGEPDYYLRAQWAERGLTPASPADHRTLLRRVTFAVTGLPPAPAAVAAFDRDHSPAAYAALVDALLASPAFGERWGRHWLDLVRYGETRGHEFDYIIPNASEYRDAVVRAINADVPYDRFVREHLAGDVLPEPRIDPRTGANESSIAAGFWHLGEEVHSPVDIRQDEADRFDNRIDVATKTFLGLTVACARCHDHKFDAISARDYAGLFGVLEGCSYRQQRIDGWRENRAVAAELHTLRSSITANGTVTPAPADPNAIVDYARLNPGEWLPDDVTFGPAPRPAGALRLHDGKLSAEPRTAAVFDRFWCRLSLAPGTARDAEALGKTVRAGFTVRTPSFVLTKPRVYLLVRGGGLSYAAVGQHALIAGPLHGKLVQRIKPADDYRWVTHDLSGYLGQRLHLELTADPATEFAVARVVQSDAEPPLPPPEFRAGDPLVPDVDGTVAAWQARERELTDRVRWQSRLAVTCWDGTPVDAPVFVRGNPRTPGPVVPHRSLEALAGTAPLKHSHGSGRLELARQWTDPQQTPLIARVQVNRVWHHLFGRGLVASPDNFGVLGERPTHPQLLDALADDFVRRDGLNWSVKALIRKLVLTDAYRMSSTGVAGNSEIDPANLFLHTFRLKRLEGEAIRDAILAVSGRLDSTVGGSSVPLHLTPFLAGRGRPGESGPLDGAGRRSIYLAVRRNFLSPFLQTFDTPIPFSTVARRPVSNVPAQALILMNDPFVHEQAERWAKLVLSRPGTTDERVAGMYVAAFGRSPTVEEVAACRAFVSEGDNVKAWGALGHALWNVKEFLYVR